jgi:hypothetical protein
MASFVLTSDESANRVPGSRAVDDGRMLKSASCMANGRWKMAKHEYFQAFFPFTIDQLPFRPALFSGLT